MKKIFCLLVISLLFAACDDKNNDGIDPTISKLFVAWELIDSSSGGESFYWADYIQFRPSSDGNLAHSHYSTRHLGGGYGTRGCDLSEPGIIKFTKQTYSYVVEYDILTIKYKERIGEIEQGDFEEQEGATYIYKQIDLLPPIQSAISRASQSNNANTWAFASQIGR